MVCIPDVCLQFHDFPYDLVDHWLVRVGGHDDESIISVCCVNVMYAQVSAGGPFGSTVHG